jgi:hypothetical protein
MNFFLAEGKNLVIQAGATADTRLTISDDNDKIWLEKTIKGSKQGYEAISVQLPKENIHLVLELTIDLAVLCFPKRLRSFLQVIFMITPATL